MEAWQRNYKKNFWIVQGFNEPDYGSGKTATDFTGSLLGGGCTLSCDQANSWYYYISSGTAVGTTHCLAGTVSSYVSFIQNVLSKRDMPFNPEAHNLCEAMIGSN